MRTSCRGAGMPCEVIVNVDNPHEAGLWAQAANASEGALVPIFSANLHEARGYNRGAKAARGKILIIWQDDQTPPPTHGWLQDLVRLYDTYPRLGVIGMNTYRLCSFKEPTNRFGDAPWAVDARTGVQWTYAQNVDFAPFAIRAHMFTELGMLEEGSSRPGDCGIWGDWELCQRAWAAGWQVGFYGLHGRGSDGRAGGTHSYVSGEKCWGQQQHVSSSLYHKRYAAMESYAIDVCVHVWKLNLQTFSVGGGCPYGTHDTRWPDNCTLPEGLGRLPRRAAAARARAAALA
ncbi:hypothetical protein HYH03_011458 [Edaphochlamys debaryana]|uniref:Glycosyltransferase 2-like domain-containing protein n=1 Tax=Edaphochlamys debaryana TaxID=47281 RepID=A0A835XUS0_9CHLO|nr:hypothetical protein HYH03_011458 [Edaphochlamys debaryana]|eukprot:KAG2490154.1 hypothetical protein HYH03_011458 [Edaphochlamys debaryana]